MRVDVHSTKIGHSSVRRGNGWSYHIALLEEVGLVQR